MILSLWRGTHKLGELFLRGPRTPGYLSGVLLPVADLGPLPGVIQSIQRNWPGAPMRHTPLAADHYPAPPRAEKESSSSAMSSFPVTHAQLPSIDAQNVFSIRENEDSAIDFDSIVVREIRLMPGSERGVADLPAGAVHEGSVWLISGHRFKWPPIESK